MVVTRAVPVAIDLLAFEHCLLLLFKVELILSDEVVVFSMLLVGTRRAGGVAEDQFEEWVSLH